MVKAFIQKLYAPKAEDLAGASWTPLESLNQRTWVPTLRLLRDEDEVSAAYCGNSPKRRKTGSFLRAGLLTLDDVAIHRVSPKASGKSHDFALTTRGGRPICSPVSRTSARPRLWFSDSHERHPRTATMVLLTPHKTINYYHWITEVLGNLWLLKKNGLHVNQIEQYLMAYSGAEWQDTILQLAGIQPERVSPISGLEDQFVDRMMLPSWGEVTYHSLPKWLSDAIHACIGFTRPTTPGERLIYLSRRSASRRKVLNEEALVERIQAYGFQCYECGDLSFQQQQDLMASARVVMAPHGAALTNLLWCAPRTEVIELHAHRHQDQSFHLLARQLGLRYRAHSIAGPIHSSRTREDDLELDEHDFSVVEWLIRDSLDKTAE